MWQRMELDRLFFLQPDTNLIQVATVQTKFALPCRSPDGRWAPVSIGVINENRVGGWIKHLDSLRASGPQQQLTP